MTGILARFWLRRFVLVFAIVGVALTLLERFMSEGAPSYLEAIGWAALAGLVAASIATYWARRHGCAVPGRSP